MITAEVMSDYYLASNSCRDRKSRGMRLSDFVDSLELEYGFNLISA